MRMNQALGLRVYAVTALGLMMLCGGVSQAAPTGAVPDAFRELLDLSKQEKSGLTFYLNGQTLPAIVTKINDDGTVEGRNQQYDRIVIRLNRVNAITKN